MNPDSTLVCPEEIRDATLMALARYRRSRLTASDAGRAR
jgi:hypothetical protein